MSLLRIAAVLATLAPGCPGASEPGDGAELPPTSAREPKPLGPVESVERTATIHMPAHFADLLEVHSALIRGSVVEARAAATEIVAERPSVMLESWAPYLYATHDAATAVSTAVDLRASAAAAAELARSCGACHAAQAARLSRTPVSPPPDSGDDRASMQRHKWAFDRLWESLVLPSDAAWKAGVDAFVELPSCADDLAGEQDREAIRRARETVRSHEQAARKATTLEERALIYGALLPTCATCHASGC
jgi:cytochrome c5